MTTGAKGQPDREQGGIKSTVVRAAQDYNREALCRLYHQFHEFHVRGVPYRPLSLGEPLDSYEGSDLYQALGEIMANDDATLFVADTQGDLVGFVEVYLRQDEGHLLRVCYRYGHIQSLMVSKWFRQQGIGTKLLEEAQQWAKAKGATEIRLDTWEFVDGPLQFWEKSGYQTLRRKLVREL